MRSYNTCTWIHKVKRKQSYFFHRLFVRGIVFHHCFLWSCQHSAFLRVFGLFPRHQTSNTIYNTYKKVHRLFKLRCQLEISFLLRIPITIALKLDLSTEIRKLSKWYLFYQYLLAHIKFQPPYNLSWIIRSYCRTWWLFDIILYNNLKKQKCVIKF